MIKIDEEVKEVIIEKDRLIIITRDNKIKEIIKDDIQR